MSRPADPPVAVPGPASAPDCVCAEINIRHCPVHGQGEPGPASVSPAEVSALREVADATKEFCLFVGNKGCQRYDVGEPCCIERGDETLCVTCRVGQAFVTLERTP